VEKLIPFSIAYLGRFFKGNMGFFGRNGSFCEKISNASSPALYIPNKICYNNISDPNMFREVDHLMTESIITAGLGILVSILGIINMTGNISSIHKYHRSRVTEENKKPFGKLVGMGTLLIGLALILFAVLQIVAERTQLDILVLIGTALLIACAVVGIAISFYAMKKYNGGIF
jgi:hypothetical protein